MSSYSQRSIVTFLSDSAKFIVTVLLLTFALFYVGCTAPDLDGVDLPRTADGRGLVKRVDSANKQITIAHEKVGDIIDQLTMAYPVQSLDMLDSITDYDSVAFTLREDEPGNFMITKLQKL
jgi:Cu/Ag efflux protein CusF